MAGRREGAYRRGDAGARCGRGGGRPRRWQVCAQQIFTWRREMRGGPSAPSGFVPIVAEAPTVAPTPSIEVKLAGAVLDRKSTRLNSSHANISYAVFCLKKKNYI